MTSNPDNLLSEEKSPYLQQHADNPVNWRPWGGEAFEEARERNVPVFLSIGYSACHWCHVMEDESFEDEETAQILNENFVAVKVDREERPDVDRVYQLACQLTSGRGGWPLSAFLTPNKKPFHVGTYYPDEPRRGMPSFQEVLERIHEAWGNDRDEVEETADKLARRIEREDEPDGRTATPDDDMLTTAGGALLDEADRDKGGFGRGQKFPQPSRVDVLLRAWERTDRSVFLDVAKESMDAWVRGGLHDHVGGGFHRYCVDSDWTVPHFEKMLYDNAEIPRVLLDGYRATGDGRYADAARRTFEFLEREMRGPEGSFYSTLDAQSVDEETGDKEEGAFYVWAPEEVRESLGEDAELFIERYGITEGGNFEGRNVLTISKTLEEFTEERNETPEETRKELRRVREKARGVREGRPRPNRDEKVLASWNGLVVSALAKGAVVLEDDRYSELADDALSFVRETLWDDEETYLFRRYKDDEVAVDGYLDDYAFVGRGALDLFSATGDPSALEFALSLGDEILGGFYDGGALYYTRDTDELVSRTRETTDTSTPASAGVAAELLVSLSSFDERYEEPAESAVETHVAEAGARPVGHESVVLASDRFTSPSEVVPANEHDDWRDAVSSTYTAGALVAPRPPTDEELEDAFDGVAGGFDATKAPVWEGRGARDEGTGYVCRNFTCSPPISPDDFEEWFDRLG